jgi:hypothetical protein
MGNNKNSKGLSVVTLVVLIGMLIASNVSAKVQIILFICGVLFLISSYTIGLLNKKSSTPKYIYVGGIGLCSLYLLYLLSKTYFGWGEGVQGILILLAFIPLIVSAPQKSVLSSKNIHEIITLNIELKFFKFSNLKNLSKEL